MVHNLQFKCYFGVFCVIGLYLTLTGILRGFGLMRFYKYSTFRMLKVVGVIALKYLFGPLFIETPIGHQNLEILAKFWF